MEKKFGDIFKEDVKKGEIYYLDFIEYESGLRRTGNYEIIRKNKKVYAYCTDSGHDLFIYKSELLKIINDANK